MSSKVLSASEKSIADKILHILTHFPQVTPSMMQISLGSGIPTEVWKPVLEKLISTGDIYKYQKSVTAPSGRSQVLTILSTIPEDKSPE